MVNRRQQLKIETLKDWTNFVSFFSMSNAIYSPKYCGLADSATFRSSSISICSTWFCFAWVSLDGISGAVGLMTAPLQNAARHKIKSTNCNEQKQTQTHYKPFAQNHFENHNSIWNGAITATNILLSANLTFIMVDSSD